MKIFLSKMDLKGLKFQDNGDKKTSWVQLFRLGEWRHPRYGRLTFTEDIFDGFIKSFDENVRKIELAIDAEHEPEKGACGWIRKLENRDNGLWALVEWTSRGFQLVSEGIFKYLSGDFDYEWKDEETGKKYKNVLFGAALTNRPFIKGMSPINLSEFRKELEEDETIHNSFQLAEDLIKLKEGDKVKTDVEILAAKDEDLTEEERKKKADLLVKKKEEEAVQLKKKLAGRAKKIGLQEDSKEEDIKKREDELKERAKAVGLPEDATIAEIEKAEKEKKLAEDIKNENEQRVARAKKVGLSADATLDEIEKAEQEAVTKQREMEKNKNLVERAKKIGLAKTATEEEIITAEVSILLKDIPTMEKKLIELRESKADEFTVKLLEENIASRKKLAEEQLKNGKEKIELKLKEHWKNGKLTTKERDTLVAILCADLEVGETSFKLSEKDKDGKDVKTIKKLSDVIDAILSDRPVIVELKEIAIKELKEPPEDNSKELEEKEATEIGSRVAGKVTKATKTAKKLAETE